MPELLLEIFSEEIPARMQARAAADLERAVNQRFIDAGFMPEGVKAFATPRRLALVASGLPARQPDRRQEKKGPRVGAPEKAVAGFLKSAGLESLDDCETRSDKKGEYYVAVIEEAGRETAAVIAEFVPEIIRGFAWPKSMRWGDGELRWVRPLKSILCTFDGEIVDFEVGGVRSGDVTQGHRFMAPGGIRVRNFEKYEAALRGAKVLLDGAARRELIVGEAKTLCEAQGLQLVEDAGLLNEVAGLAEWPVVMIGSFDEKFLALPDEVLTASMRGHQKYFSVSDPKTKRLANKFVFVANIEASDGGSKLRVGYERVLTARLSDAWFLYQQDLKIPLADRIVELDRIIFFEGLGSVGDKARRVEALAEEIALAVGADPALAGQAALLAKADLVTAMVGEFPELQGVMGRYYALAQNTSHILRDAPKGAPQDEDRASGKPASAKHQIPHPEEAQSAVAKDVREIADAIRDHYKPKGQDDEVPTAPVSVAVALADKIDTLTAFWAIDKKPTGSKDPFALRRAALGIIQAILGNNLRMQINKKVNLQYDTIMKPKCEAGEIETSQSERVSWETFSSPDSRYSKFQFSCNSKLAFGNRSNVWLPSKFPTVDSLLAFFHDRLKVYLRDKDHRHDHIDAVLSDANGNLQDDLVLIARKLKALEVFLKTDNGENLVAAYKRAANILKAEEKKDVGRVERSDTRQTESDGGYRPSASTRPTVDESLLAEPQEKALYAALKVAEAKAAEAVDAENFEAAMAALASLRAPLDAFFDKVTVNADDAALRANRLSLLARLTAATATVADFSKLEG